MLLVLDGTAADEEKSDAVEEEEESDESWAEQTKHRKSTQSGMQKERCDEEAGCLGGTGQKIKGS